MSLLGSLTALLPVDGAGTSALVTRLRDGATATVSLPEPFVVDGPLETGAISRSSGAITIRWRPADGVQRMTWIATSNCPSGTAAAVAGDTVPDRGELAISASRMPAAESGACAASLSLRREREGALGAAFPAGSTISGAQERTVAFTLVP